MPEIKQKMKVKVQAKLTERHPKSGKVLRVKEMPEHVLDNPKLVKALKKRGLGKKKNKDKGKDKDKKKDKDKGNRGGKNGSNK